MRRHAFTIAFLFAAAAIAAGQRGNPATAVEPLALTLDATTHLLVVAPHPDDETIGAGGLMQRVRARGGTVDVVLLTSGDGFPEGVEAADGIAHPGPSDFRGYGALREREALTALARLGVPRAHVTFLGFPDEGLCRIASTYLFDKRREFESPYTGREGPPPAEQIVRGARYRGIDLRRELERIIDRVAPTLVVLPHPEDEHPDHCSAHIFTREALGAVAPDTVRRIHVLHYLVHYAPWPTDAPAAPGEPLAPPASFPPAEGAWRTLALTSDEAAAKREALLSYTSQMQVIGRLLLAFARPNELFLEGEPASLPECWCDGENVATEAPPAKYRRRPAPR